MFQRHDYFPVVWLCGVIARESIFIDDGADELDEVIYSLFDEWEIIRFQWLQAEAYLHAPFPEDARRSVAELAKITEPKMNLI